MCQYPYVGGCVVVCFTYLDFSLVNNFQDGADDGRGGLTTWNPRDDEYPVIRLVDLGAYFYRLAAFPVIIFGYVGGTTCLEVGV